MNADSGGRHAAVLLAGGSGTRLQRSENKVYLRVGERPLLSWSLEAFQSSPSIDQIVLVVREGDQRRAQEIVDQLGATKLTTIVLGGSTRHESEHAGLEALAEDISSGAISLVCIHDAARPFVSQELLTEVLETAARIGGAVPGLPLDAEVLLRADEDGKAPTPVITNDLRRVQTPQAFHAQPLLDAYRHASTVGFHGVDTAQSVERFTDLEVEIVPGDPANVKVTYVGDLLAAEETARTWPRCP